MKTLMTYMTLMTSTTGILEVIIGVRKTLVTYMTLMTMTLRKIVVTSFVSLSHK